ncbi:MAG: hypothetical protein H7276_04835 [Caulobacter sp.]|nr:hypothetical protein [Vitreoscilla sp.]
MATSLRISPRDAIAQARGWGWPFVTGAVVLALAGGVGLGLVPALRRESEAVALDADAAAHRAAQSGAALREARATGPTSDRFMAGFPAADVRQARVAALLALAVHHALELRQGEFQLGQDKATGLARYVVTLPLSGSYVQLRAFIEEALGTDAALSLDRLRLRRASTGAAVVEAELTWSFYMRPRDAPSDAGTR